MKKIILFAFMIVMGVIACENTGRELSTDIQEKFLALGDSITTHTQAVLLSNVGAAMKEGGPVNAVAYCNLQAMPLTDSLSSLHNVEIRRFSDKYRNPENAIAESREKGAWEKLQESTASGNYNNQHFLDVDGDTIFYYKPIPIGMPTCLACHGSIENDISPETMAEINAKYPADLATGYKMGELRGMWRVSMIK